MWSRAGVVLSGLVFLLGICDQSTIRQNQHTLPSCPVTSTIEARAPREPGVGPLEGAWYMNADRSIWAMHIHPWTAGVGDKVPWIRPVGAQLEIVGRRVDGSAPPLKVQIPGGYSSRFQATGMEFPVEGCWEVTGKAGGKLLRFVTKVERGKEARK